MPVDEVYDWDDFERRTSPPPPVRGRGGVGAAALAAALWAVEDVLLEEKRRTPIVEEAEVPTLDPTERVVVHLVPGNARASRAFVRWRETGAGGS